MRRAAHSVAALTLYSCPTEQVEVFRISFTSFARTGEPFSYGRKEFRFNNGSDRHWYPLIMGVRDIFCSNAMGFVEVHGSSVDFVLENPIHHCPSPLEIFSFSSRCSACLGRCRA